MRVLIAEDNGVWRKLLEQNARSWGFEPVLAEDGNQAWDILQREDAPRLAILDWQMPGIDGIDVCRKIKSSDNLPFTYVVLLTGRDADADMVAGLDAGADDYLTKPVQPAVLRSRLAAAKRIVEVVPPKEWSLPRVPGYEVLRLIGKGAFGTVWEAIQQSTGRSVALKVIRIDLATDEVFSRFAREVQILERMDHPNIAHVYDSQVDRKLAYCAMELIDGMTLEKHVKDLSPKVRLVLNMAALVCDALEHAHQQGIVHRDLKPSNIMITRDGQPKLVDFGLGKWMFRPNAIDETAQTLDGSVIGTPMFMAPEQARGENDKIDARTDIYALGIVVYILLIRRHPHNVNEKSRWETVRAIAEGHPRRPSELRPGFDPELEQILMRALANEQQARYQSAADYGTALRRFVHERLGRKKPLE